MRSLADGLAAGTVILDGGLSTELEARGHDVSSALWSARLLRDDPAAIVAAHAAFAAAGAQVATTASYQATVEGFGAAGVDAAEARRLIASSVALAREGQGVGWVAGSVGPVRRDARRRVGVHRRVRGRDVDRRAARLPPATDGAARRGRRRRPRLRDRARRRRGRGADRRGGGARGARSGSRSPRWSDDDGVVRTRRGERAADVFAMTDGVDAVIAVGVNCTAPAAIGPSVAAASVASKPVVVYPNSGEGWDAVHRSWTGTPGHRDGRRPRLGRRRRPADRRLLPRPPRAHRRDRERDQVT